MPGGGHSCGIGPRGRGLSGFVARAVEHELERDALASYLDGLDDEYGNVPNELIEHYDALWPS